MTVCAVWLARDFLHRTGRPIDIPPCTDSPNVKETAMTTATPMHEMDRADTYLRRGTRWTPRQRRRYAHKQNADTSRRLAQLVADNPEIELCDCHISRYCIGCLFCQTCDGCECH